MRFMVDCTAGNLDQHNFKVPINHDTEMNCYCLHASNILKEIIYRKIYINERKIVALCDAQDELTQEANHFKFQKNSSNRNSKGKDNHMQAISE